MKVVDADGRSILWNEVSHFDDGTMRNLMCQLVNRLHAFDANPPEPRFVALMGRCSHVAMYLDEPYPAPSC